MNIMLTDIRSLTLDMQEVPAVAPAAADGFTGVMRRQLPDSSDKASQVIEFKEDSSATAESPAVSDTSPMASWREYLAQERIRVTTDADPAASTPVELAAVFVNPLQQPDPQAMTGISAGDPLPVSGKLLPDSVISGANISGKALTATAFDMDLSLPPNSIMPVDDGVASVASATLRDLNSTRLPGGLSLIESGARPNLGAGINIIARGVENPALSMQPIGEAGSVQIPNVASEGNFGGARMAAGVAMSSAVVDMDTLPAGDSKSAAESIALRPESDAGELARLSDPADALKVPAQLLKSNPEAGVGESTGNRGSDLPTQSATSQTQQSIITGHPATQATVIATGGVVQATSLNALPSQFEPMGMSPNADSSEWGNGLGERVSWMINQKQNTATIRLDPPMLGKLDVLVKITDDATTITIQTQHAQTRDLIESASARLRDFLQESGFQNVNVDVSQRQDQQQAGSQMTADGQDEPADDFHQDQEQDFEQRGQVGYLSGDGLVDTFA